MELTPDLLAWYRLYFRAFCEEAPSDLRGYGYDGPEPNGTAASLESLVAFARAAGDPAKVTVLNAGAGASSWILRRLFPRVVCTDPDERYLGFVASLCMRHGLDGTGFVHRLRACEPADVTFYDYGDWDVRWTMMGLAWEKTRRMMYVDDADDRPHNTANRAYVHAFARELGLQGEDRPDAIDEHGRWGIVFRRTPLP